MMDISINVEDYKLNVRAAAIIIHNNKLLVHKNIHEDYYALLEIKRTASQDEIKKAYRKFAKQYHPDSNIGNPEAEEMIKEINEAYEVLSDEKRKKKHYFLLGLHNYYW